MLTHYNLVANIAQCDGIEYGKIKVAENDLLMGILPFYHIYGMIVVMNLAFYMGATVVTMPRFDLEQFLQIIQQYEVTVAHLVPPIILALAKHPLVEDLICLRCG